MTTDIEAALALHRPALLRHCYRMVGSFAEAEDLVQDVLERAWKASSSYRGEASVQRWLYAIATNTCLNALAQPRRKRELPQLEGEPIIDEAALGEPERASDRWVTPAPDACLFPSPGEATESRETVALAFVALLQRVPPRQRAVLLLKDVLGWSAEEIAHALGLTLSSVNSALLRARASIQRETPTAKEPSPDALRAFVSAWETRNLDALLRLLRDDIALAMPPWIAWFRGRAVVSRFLGSERFGAVWARLTRVELTRANGLPALAFFRNEGGVDVPHAILVPRFVADQVVEMTVFIGLGYFKGFEFS